MKRLLAVCLPLLLMPAPTAAQAVVARLAVDMRGPIAAGWFDPATETVGVRGGVSPLAWDRSLAAADPDRDGVFEVLVMFAARPGADGVVAYKFKVEGTGNPNDGWEEGPNRPLVFSKPSVAVSRVFNSHPDAFPSTLTGTARRHPGFESQFLPARDVVVLLPPGYDRERTRRYPVLYLHDGQNVFDASTSNGGEWRVDETSAALVRAGRVEPAIVVGVYNTADRIDEYTPTAAELKRGGEKVRMGGKADLYGRFLVEELKPFVDRTYRTRPGAGDTALGGSSLGGLVTMHLGLKYPNVFGKLLVVSPSVWWDGERILESVRALAAPTAQRVWVDIGTAEGDEALTGARHLKDALVAKGWVLGENLRYVEANAAGHDEAAWAARFGEMLRFVFPKR